MQSVYIFGPIYLFGEDYLPVYKRLTALCKNYFDEVICTFPDFWNSNESPQEFYTRTYDTIKNCDLFIGEVSSPSMGVGMEFQIAQEHNIPCIAIAKNGTTISSMIEGIPCTKRIIYYKDFEDVTRLIELAINDFKEGNLQ